MNITLELPAVTALPFLRHFRLQINDDNVPMPEHSHGGVVVHNMPYVDVVRFFEHHGPGGYELRRHHGTDRFALHALFVERYRETC